MSTLYLEIFNCDSDSNQIEVPLESLIIYFIYNYCKTTAFKLYFVFSEKIDNEPIFYIKVSESYNLVSKDSLPLLATYCILPNVIINNIVVISGLGSVARQIIKSVSENENFKKLLGFREACLMACNESSTWTKFCEIDMISTTKNYLQNPDTFLNDNKIILPGDLSRFDYHLSLPVRIHNIYKVVQDQAKLNNKNISDINTTIPKEKLELTHLYAEGPYMTLADIILYPLICVALNTFGENLFKNNLSRTYIWYNNMQKQIKLFDFTFSANPSVLFSNELTVIQQNIKKESLYLSDPNRYKPRNRIFTKQSDITNALNKIEKLNLNTDLHESPFGNEIDFDWSIIPLEANPKGGALPKSRMKRKCEQLENLAKPVIKIAQPDQTIIDFCSGSGHLGILLAVKLPKCKIILLENKEKSLNRALTRVETLQLQNIIFLQCNLDYFIGNFDIGVSLHACGVATDLVIQQCLKRNAAFVSCPCCYGGVHDCHHITYPRSKIFQNSLSLHDYLVIGHSADQTHDSKNAKTKQGIECMDIIDTDRKLQAEELGYEVILGKMIPPSCTPKNNIIIGFPTKLL